MNLKSWLIEERGRTTALAAHLGVSVSRVSQMADEGVPDKYKFEVRAFSRNRIPLESMVRRPSKQREEA